MNKEFAFTRIGYVYVPTSNIDESIEWYTRNLDFKLINKFQDRGSFLAVLLLLLTHNVRRLAV
jgi:catechol 2,3-dioxygenase-like lactoylglutathione lyase family enzyme